MKEDGRISAPRRRRKDHEVLTAIVPDAVAGPSMEPTHQDIARRAYQRYQERGGEHGRDQEDWFQAEREMRQLLQDAVGQFPAAESPYAVV